jgi:hypothetical protein
MWQQNTSCKLTLAIVVNQWKWVDENKENQKTAIISFSPKIAWSWLFTSTPPYVFKEKRLFKYSHVLRIRPALEKYQYFEAP